METKYSSEFVFKFLRENNYQTERGEQEYMMYFDVDIPKIINDFINYVSEDIPKKVKGE